MMSLLFCVTRPSRLVMALPTLLTTALPTLYDGASHRSILIHGRCRARQPYCAACACSCVNR